MFCDPQHRITNGVLWHRVRGHLQIFVAVDSHVLLQGGPIYGSHAITVDTEPSGSGSSKT